MQWIGRGGEQDPIAFGAAMQRFKEKEAKTKRSFPCPVPEYIETRNVKRVADWWYGGDGDKAMLMKTERPARFNEILGWANVEAEAEPIAMEYAQAKHEQKHGKPGAKKPPPPLKALNVGEVIEPQPQKPLLVNT